MIIMTLVGTRPEIIRLSSIIKLLDESISNRHILVHVAQNYDPKLSDIFFKELEIRKPDITLSSEYSTFGEFIGKNFIAFEQVIKDYRPDKLLILGDTNTGLLSIVANKYNIPIYHMEAGNRCYDAKQPEESNRKIIDSISSYNLPYTDDAKQILLKEGYDRNKVIKIGNPIYEVLMSYDDEINNSNILEFTDIEVKNYILVTFHRAENIQNKNTLTDIVNFINSIDILWDLEVVISLHPNTKKQLDKFELKFDESVKVFEPFGFFDFAKLEKNASFIITDSGTVQEEACIFQVPCIIIRNSTERRETIECGASVLSSNKYDDMVNSIRIVQNNSWMIPFDYLSPKVSEIVYNVLMSKN